MQIIDIGRRTIFGNPYKAKPTEKLMGKTLPFFESYMRHAGERLPWFKEAVCDLVSKVDAGEAQMHCPGCREHSAKDGICHGSILLKVGREWVKEGAAVS